MNTAIPLIPASAPDAPPALTPYAQRTIRRAVNLLDKHLRQPGVILLPQHPFATGCVCNFRRWSGRYLWCCF